MRSSKALFPQRSRPAACTFLGLKPRMHAFLHCVTVAKPCWLEGTATGPPKAAAIAGRRTARLPPGWIFRMDCPEPAAVCGVCSLNNPGTALCGVSVMIEKDVSDPNPKIDPAPNSNTEKEPDDWVSGNDPMTG